MPRTYAAPGAIAGLISITTKGHADLVQPGRVRLTSYFPYESHGISVEQGAFGEWGAGYDPVAATSPLSNAEPGEHGRIYSYPSAATYRFLAGRGITWIRLPFRWERLQRSPGAPLDATELARLRASVRAAIWELLGPVVGLVFI